MFGNIEDMKRNREASNALAEMLEDIAIGSGSPYLKAALTLGRECRLFTEDMKRLIHPIDGPEEEAVQIYTDALEYVRLAHEGLRSFMKAHVEKYGEGVIGEPV